MESVETLIPDKEGNHLVVVLYFYDEQDKVDTFQIPDVFFNIDIADININKLDINKPLNIRAFFDMCQWLLDQFMLFPNAVFSFICSTDPLETRHSNISPEQYRWGLFECLFERNRQKLIDLGIYSREIIVGPQGYSTFARIFFREKHAPIIHIVSAHLISKYADTD